MMLETEETLMQRCLSIAKLAFGATRSNPMVASILVYKGEIVSEGYHESYGKPHAEVNAIDHLSDKSILKDCTLYVNLEPCSHHGKTPPCADLIISSGIKNIVIGSNDPNPKVAGNGIKKLIAAGCNIKSGVLEEECRKLNKRFYTFHEKKRPWIILKWAQSSDNLISRNGDKQTIISSLESRTLTHQWRTEEMSILVGTQTALSDNPKLTARLYSGINPVRIVLDRKLTLPISLNIFDQSSSTLVFSEAKSNGLPSNVEIIQINFDKNILNSICSELHSRNIISSIIEGGAKTLNYWIKDNLWDEARIFHAQKLLGNGTVAPDFQAKPSSKEMIGTDSLYTYYNKN